MNKLLIAIIAAAGFAVPGRSVAADAAAGKEKSQLCAACHGSDGNTPMMPEYPKLAGQPADYLEKVLRDYKKGARKNPVDDALGAGPFQAGYQGLGCLLLQPEGRSEGQVDAVAATHPKERSRRLHFFV